MHPTQLNLTMDQSSEIKPWSVLLYLIIYMKKFLHFHWLRAVHFFSKTVQKRVNSVPKKKETNQAF